MSKIDDGVELTLESPEAPEDEYPPRQIGNNQLAHEIKWILDLNTTLKTQVENIHKDLEAVTQTADAVEQAVTALDLEKIERMEAEIIFANDSIKHYLRELNKLEDAVDRVAKDRSLISYPDSTKEGEK